MDHPIFSTLQYVAAGNEIHILRVLGSITWEFTELLHNAILYSHL